MIFSFDLLIDAIVSGVLIGAFYAAVTAGVYRARNLVERFFNKVKQCRRVATRYDKVATNYLAFIKRPSIRIWLRVYVSAP